MTGEPQDQFRADRAIEVKDKHGNTWRLGTRIEDLTQEEADRGVAEAMMKK